MLIHTLFSTLKGSGKNGNNGSNATTSDLNEFQTSADTIWQRGKSSFENAQRTARRKSTKNITYCFRSQERWGDGYISTTFSSGKKLTYMCVNLLKCLCLIEGSDGTLGGKGGNRGFGGNLSYSFFKSFEKY